MSKTRENEQGIVSILVTMIMILVISLTVLGFAQISRRNQREALDNQLSTQAYYAAESGVNAAINYLTDPVNIDANINNTNCTDFFTTSGISNTLDATTNTKYTCLMVNTQPTTLNVAPLTQTSNTILHMENADNNPPGPVLPFTQLAFQWQQQTGTDFPSGPCTATGGTGSILPSMGAWNCPYGILRLDLTDASAISSANLTANKNTTSFYFIPSYSSGAAFYSVAKPKPVGWPPVAATAPCTATGNDNCPVEIIPVTCSAGGNCNIQLNLAGGSGDYFARLSMMYQDSSSVTVTAGDASHNIASGGVKFTGGQAVIDSTGQAQDELRRIQVRIPLVASSGSVPVYGLQTTQSICKLLSDGPGLTTQDDCDNPVHP